jgi:hypothetical protein
MGHQFSFSGDKAQIENNIRWCRQQFGPRGRRWDFTGSYTKIILLFWEDKDASWYALSWSAERLGNAAWG